MNKKEYTRLKNKVGVIDYTKSYTIKTTSDTGNRLKMLLSSGFEVLYDLLEEKFYAIKLSEDRKEVLYSFISPDFLNLYDLINKNNTPNGLQT
jgi:hypothetical protein